jgi:hypothetical protein
MIMQTSWVVKTPTHVYGPFLSEEVAASVPVTSFPHAIVREMIAEDTAAMAEQDAELAELDGQFWDEVSP